MPELYSHKYLLDLLADDVRWSIFTQLAGMSELDRGPILRPHVERVAGHPRRHQVAREAATALPSGQEPTPDALRERLDNALDALTLIEIGFETKLLPKETCRDKAWKQGGLGAFHTLVMESESFYGYATANLYFAVRILAWRCFGPCWPPRISSSLRSDVSTNRRSFPIMVPPPLALPSSEEPNAGDALFFDSIQNQQPDERWNKALRFLDDLEPEGRGADGYENPERAAPSLYQEPAEYELWLRGLLPDVEETVAQHFETISSGLVAWAQQRTDFYLRLQSTRFKAADMTWVDPTPMDMERAFLPNPLTARFAQADIYWLARLMRAEVSSHAAVRYGHNPWLSLLAFRADLDGKTTAYQQTLKDNERTLQLVFNFACDLGQNCAALAELSENQHFNPWQYPEADAANSTANETADAAETQPTKPGENETKEWRAVFDEELREIDRQRSARTYVDPAFPRGEGFPWNAKNATSYFSERLITGRQPYNRVGLAFSGGGIRSATFNLGVLQGLQELNLLREIDYLSTVSGGGFIGAWLAGNVARTRQWLTKGTRWTESINHLRSYASYLAPLNGILSADTWTLGASWARNTFLIQLTGITWLLVLLLVPLAGRKVFLALAASYPSQGISLPWTRWLCPSGLHLPWLGFLALAMGCIAAFNLARNFKMNRVETGEDVPRTAWVRWHMVLPCWVGSFAVAAILYSVAQNWLASPPASLPLSLATCRTLVCSGVPGVPSMPRHAHDFGFLLRRVWERLDVLLLAHWVLLLFIGWYALQPADGATSRWASTPRRRSMLTGWRCLWIGTACSVVLYLGLCGVVALNLAWMQPPERFASFAFVFGPALVLAVFTLSLVLFIGLSGRTSNEAQREWWTRFGAWVLIFALLGLTLSAAAVLSPRVVLKMVEWTPHWLKAVRWAAVLGWLGTVAGGVLAGKSSKTAGDGWSKSLDTLARVGGLLFVLGSVVATATVLYLVLWNIARGENANLTYWQSLDAIGYQTLLAAAALVLLCGTIFSWYFEINIFGLSQLYRNRLVRCYLGASRWAAGVRKPHPFTKFDFRDDMPLSDLRNDERGVGVAENEFRGPFPIFNCTLNLGGSSDLALHSRHSASFALTPLRCGADRPRVGYAPTRESSSASFANGVMLGQAVAISGAAASPNMGYNTSPLVALLLTMFNVRLGWWFPNPGRERWAERGLRFSLYYLTRELLGTANENRDFLNVSDGGHFENLGVYELIRRRCKVIIASDAECDELLQFGGLGNLVRICATDFGAEINLDVRSIAQQKDGHSLAHSSIGTITYSNGSIGYLIYLKASMTGDEKIGIEQYRSAHPSFPHETTANQFYSESQFEAYRMLGQHVVERAFRGVLPGEPPLQVARKLADVMAPARTSGAAYLKHTRALDELWQQFRKSPSLHSFLDELMRILPPLAVAPATASFHQQTEELGVALQLMQLMEDVFMDLQLDDFWEHPDNRGWALLFMRWARSLRFRSYWNQTHRTLGIRFEYFCAARLGLKRDVPIVRM